jgi:hypothetical protein
MAKVKSVKFQVEPPHEFNEEPWQSITKRTTYDDGQIRDKRMTAVRVADLPAFASAVNAAVVAAKG